MDLLETAIWKETFFKDNFSVDQCLAEYTQKSDLETLRRDLKNYGTELQLQMSDILKNETEAIVNLAEYLTNLNSKIDNLSVPISQLREEIRTLYDLIKTAEHSYNLFLSEIKNNKSEQNHIHLKLGIIASSVYINTVIDSIESDLFGNLLKLERIVNKYSFQKIYLDVLNLMTPDIEKVVRKVEMKLVKNISHCFLKAFQSSDKDILLRCLRMYVDLQKEDEAYNTFQIHILRPELQQLFTERYLEKCDYNLDKVYSSVKDILRSKVDILSEVTKTTVDLSSFNFVLKSFWKEFDTQLRVGLPHITAPGNPELFQKRFTSTYNLLKYIADAAGDKSLMQLDDSFQSHLKRFNLPVYFEIKFQQIAGNFEAETYNTSLNNIKSGPNEHSFRHKVSVALWKALRACFHEDVYIDQLADHFIRLSMMLLSRYIKIIENLYKNIISSDADKADIAEFLINAIIDLNIISLLVAPKFDSISDIGKTIFAIINKNMWHIILRVIQATGKIISEAQETLHNHLISSKIKECSVHLQNVTAIPRLYRRTNRNPPKEASPYMLEAVKPIVNFESKFRSKLDHDLNEIINSIVLKLTNQYQSLVQEVLLSVCKTEESLRRLKSRTLNTSGDDSHGPSDVISDETKIREQIKYDVGYFYDKLYPLGLSSAKEAMDILRKEVCYTIK